MQMDGTENGGFWAASVEKGHGMDFWERNSKEVVN